MYFWRGIAGWRAVRLSRVSNRWRPPSTGWSRRLRVMCAVRCRRCSANRVIGTPSTGRYSATPHSDLLVEPWNCATPIRYCSGCSSAWITTRFFRRHAAGLAAPSLRRQVGDLRIPFIPGTGLPATDSLQLAIAALQDKGACAWLVDLRLNGGGNVWPMLAGIGPLLGDSARLMGRRPRWQAHGIRAVREWCVVQRHGYGAAEADCACNRANGASRLPANPGRCHDRQWYGEALRKPSWLHSRRDPTFASSALRRRGHRHQTPGSGFRMERTW